MNRRCPICSTPVLVVKDGEWPQSYPFCSERCRLLDLGGWATEKYKVPALEPDDSVGTEDDPTDKTQ